MRSLKSKSPLHARGSNNMQRRSIEIQSVFELAYFIRFGEYHANFYENSLKRLIEKLGAYALIRKFSEVI